MSATSRGPMSWRKSSGGSWNAAPLQPITTGFVPSPGSSGAVPLIVSKCLLEAPARVRPFRGALGADPLEHHLALVLGQGTDIGPPKRGSRYRDPRADVDDEDRRVPVGVEHLHVQLVVDREVHGGIGVLRERVQERARAAPDVDLRECGVTEPHRRGAEGVLSPRLGVAQEAQTRERVREPRDGGPRQPGAGGDVLVREPRVARTEAAEHVESATESPDELPICRAARLPLRLDPPCRCHERQFRTTKPALQTVQELARARTARKQTSTSEGEVRRLGAKRAQSTP